MIGVRLEGVTKVFADGTAALAGVDLAVRQGEFVSLIGPSGCGKTTVLRLVAGLETSSSGLVSVEDAFRGPEGGGLSYVFQDPTLLPWASVENNVYLPLRIAGISRHASRESIVEALDLVGLTAFADAYPHALSGGMRMRAAIARALVTRPRLLLMDEPFAALDEITRFRLNDDLLAVVERTGCTVLFVTHSVYESAYLSNRIAVMSPRPGRVVAEIPVDLPSRRTEDLRRDPRYLAATAAASAALRTPAAA